MPREYERTCGSRQRDSDKSGASLIGYQARGLRARSILSFLFGAAIWREVSRLVPPPDAARMPSLLLYLVNGSPGIVASFALVSM
jgi:hypothetical protein